jgi:hypothetical protein
MIQQDFVIPSLTTNKLPGGKNTKKKPEGEQRTHIWEIRHAGLLGIKYEVAVRDDLFESDRVKQEGGEFDTTGKEILRGVVEAAVLGYVMSCMIIQQTKTPQSWRPRRRCSICCSIVPSACRTASCGTASRVAR